MAEKFSKLELVWRIREGGQGQAQRNYLDFVADGQTLGGRLRCGDLIGCGAITVEIVKTRTGFLWKNFGYENGYDESLPDLENYKQIGEFHFKDAEYQAALIITSIRK